MEEKIITFSQKCNNNCRFCYPTDPYHRIHDEDFLDLEKTKSKILESKEEGKVCWGW